MTTNTVEQVELEHEPAIGERAFDALRHAAQGWPAASRLVEEVIEDGAQAGRAAKAVVARGADEIRDLRDGAVEQVKRRPVQAVGVGVGVGLVAGMIVSWLACRVITRTWHSRVPPADVS
jgi:ElaB/YqjD/DUF883 family membrane-anchored ribosome-binding protein